MSAAASAMDLRECALRAIADDYEEFGKIFDDVSAWLTERGTSTTRMATRQALGGLIREGYAQAYVLAAERSDAQPVFLESDLKELWFYVTPDGKRLAQELSKNWNSSLSSFEHEI
jgi:hypothetical protein